MSAAGHQLACRCRRSAHQSTTIGIRRPPARLPPYSQPAASPDKFFFFFNLRRRQHPSLRQASSSSSSSSSPAPARQVRPSRDIWHSRRQARPGFVSRQGQTSAARQARVRLPQPLPLFLPGRLLPPLFFSQASQARRRPTAGPPAQHARHQASINRRLATSLLLPDRRRRRQLPDSPLQPPAISQHCLPGRQGQGPCWAAQATPITATDSRAGPGGPQGDSRAPQPGSSGSGRLTEARGAGGARRRLISLIGLIQSGIIAPPHRQVPAHRHRHHRLTRHRRPSPIAPSQMRSPPGNTPPIKQPLQQQQQQSGAHRPRHSIIAPVSPRRLSPGSSPA